MTLTLAETAIDPARVAVLTQREKAKLVERTQRSGEYFERASGVMPGGVPSQFQKNDPWPVYIERGAGSRVWDVDGNEYLDFHNGFGVMCVGHANPTIAAAVKAQMDQGSHFAAPTEGSIAVAEELKRRWGLPFWRFTNSGTESTMDAIHLARGATGKDIIVKIEGTYHGHHDAVMVSVKPPAELMGDRDRPNAIPYGLGYPSTTASQTRPVPFNDADALERVLAREAVAAVITEPALTNVGVVMPAPGFHARVRELTRAHGALLILDETHTQTAAYGGCTRAWALEPDVVTLGKSLGGGVPVGAYGMSAELRDHLERHRDAHGRVAGIATGGTTYGNPLSLAAVVATLTQIHTPAAFDRTATLGARLAGGIEAAAARHGLPWRAHRLGGRSGYCLEPELPQTAEDAQRSLDARLIDARRLFMANRGIWEAIASAGPAASFAHDETDVDAYLDVLDAFLDAVVLA